MPELLTNIQGGFVSPRIQGVGGFNPLDLGLTAMWDAAFKTLNGDDVSQGTDLTGNGNHLNMVDAPDQPLFVAGAPAHWLFDGVSEGMLTDAFTGGPVPQPYTTILAYKFEDTSVNFSTIQDGLVSNKRSAIFIHTGVMGVYGGATTVFTAIPDTDKHNVSVVWDGADTDGYFDGGTDEITVTAGTESLTGFKIGRRYADDLEANMRFYAGLIAPRRLTAAEINQVGNYYAARKILTYTDIS